MESENEDPLKILNDLKERIKKLPIQNRKKAVFLLNKFEKKLTIEEDRNKKNDKEFEIYNKEITEITKKIDEIVDGEKNISKEIIENWKNQNEKDLKINSEDLKAGKIDNFWKVFILNNDLCKLKRYRS